MVPTELLVTAMVGGFAVAITAVLAVVGVLGSRITDLRADMGDRFDGVDLRFEQVDRRFEQVDRRFERLDGRVVGIAEQMTAVRASLGAVDARLTTLER